MRASEHGGAVPDGVGKWHCAANEYWEGSWQGPFDTREEAIGEGKAVYGETFVIGIGLEVYVPERHAESLLEYTATNVYDAIGDASEDWLRDSDLGGKVKDLDAMLAPVFAAWLTKHDLWPKFYRIGNVEVIDPTDNDHE